MQLKLFERRTATKLIDGQEECENHCVYCGAKNSVQQTNVLNILRPNTHMLKDDKGNLMMEQDVYCKNCNKTWVDVFCKTYDTGK
ncbi:MAG: hypothetical protein JSW11_00825 [Candidatus Heimdallarchaeota archaeon]|nr:MAG: hypothetical protein JSW11_00825 [Candidatus Heimdallarchaeota archaeon]